MFNKKIKLLKLGLLSFATIIATPIVASASSYYVIQEANNSELIQLKINGKNESFFSVKEAQDYILRHNMANLNQEVMVGNRRYLDRNSGMLNTSELHEYIADKDYVKPAYKMLNGNYTDSKDKALKTYIGRSHLVSQYYDFNGGYFDGTFAGREQAKDSIRKRQLDKIVPFNDASLLRSEDIHINPFNSSDQNELKRRVLDIYKSDLKKQQNSRSKKITATYLFPTMDHDNKKDAYIGVEPMNYQKGLTSDDFQEHGLRQSIEDYFDHIVKFSLEVSISSGAPYSFDNKDFYLENTYKNSKRVYTEREKEWWGLTQRNKPNYLEIRKRNQELKENYIHVSITNKKIKISNISLEYLKNTDHIDQLSAFMDHESFWKYFNEVHYTAPGPFGTTADAAVGAKLNKKLFGMDQFEINNTNSQAHSWKGGFDVVLNGKGTQYSHVTSASFESNVPWVTLQSLKNYLQSKPSTQELKKAFRNIGLKAPENFSIKYPGSLSITSAPYSTVNNSSMISGSSSAKYSIGNMKTEMEKWKLHSSENILNQMAKNTSINPPLSPASNNHKILLLDGTPIMEIDDKNIEVNNSKIIPMIEVSKNSDNNNYIYEIFKNKITSKQSGAWNSIIKPKVMKNFKTEFQFASDQYQLILRENLYQLKYNDEYKGIQPILFYRGRSEGRSNWTPKNSVVNTNIKPIKLGKILSDNSENVSIYKIGKSFIFANQAGIDDRKDQIASKYFQPPLVHVIYNDNDEVISAFQQSDSIIKFDDKETIKHNANAILSNYLRKDTNKVFIKVNDKWLKEPLNNELILVYNIDWEGNKYTFESFENVQKFIRTWIETNSNTVSERENND